MYNFQIKKSLSLYQLGAPSEYRIMLKPCWYAHDDDDDVVNGYLGFSCSYGYADDDD